jgi:hypothetical protein
MWPNQVSGEHEIVQMLLFIFFPLTNTTPSSFWSSFMGLHNGQLPIPTDVYDFKQLTMSTSEKSAAIVPNIGPASRYTFVLVGLVS